MNSKECFDNTFCTNPGIDCKDCGYWQQANKYKVIKEDTHHFVEVDLKIPIDPEDTPEKVLNEISRQLEILAAFIKDGDKTAIPSNGACNKGGTFASFVIYKGRVKK